MSSWLDALSVASILVALYLMLVLVLRIHLEKSNMTQILTVVLTVLFSFILPGRHKAWIPDFLAALVGGVIDLVDDLDDLDGLTEAEREARIVEQAREFANEAFVDVPAWAAWPEARRAEIITGLAAFAAFLLALDDDNADDSGVSPRKIRKAARKAARKQRRNT